jgi:hypothetical protein
MTVRVSNFNIGRTGTQNLTSFADSFARASAPLGQNWCEGNIGRGPIVTPLGWSLYDIGASVDATQSMQITYQGTASPNTTIPGFAFNPMLVTGVWGKSQFAQITFRDQNSTNDSQIGPVVMFRPSEAFVGYFLRFRLFVVDVDLARFAPNAGNSPGTTFSVTTLVSNINGNTINQGDVIRLSADTSVGGQVTITVHINGVLSTTFVDNIAPLSGGIPCMGSLLGSGSSHWNNWSCGVGL